MSTARGPQPPPLLLSQKLSRSSALTPVYRPQALLYQADGVLNSSKTFRSLPCRAPASRCDYRTGYKTNTSPLCARHFPPLRNHAVYYPGCATNLRLRWNLNQWPSNPGNPKIPPSPEPRGLLHRFCCKLTLFAEIWTSGVRTLEIRKFPPLRNHAVYYTGFAAN